MLVLAAWVLAGCAPSSEESDYLARRAVLQRQNQGIRELIAEAERGSLIPADRFLIGVDEKVVGELLRSELPLQLPLGKRFVVRLSDATVLLRDKFGLIQLDGEIHRPSTPERRTALVVTGGLGAVKIDPHTGLLTLDIALDHVELREAGLLEKVLGAGGKKFVAENARGMLQDALPTLKIPVALAQDLHLPALQNGPVQLDSLVVPLGLSVERVLAVGGKLWVTLHAEVGRVTGAESGLGIDVKLKPKKPAAVASPGPAGTKPVPAPAESSGSRRPGGGS